MEILGMDRGWVGNECGPDRRIGHGYDRGEDLLVSVFLCTFYTCAHKATL